MARQRIHVPDCEGTEDDLLLLTALEKRELVMRIAQEGPEALDAYIREREAEGDGLIAQKLRRLKEELLERARRLRENLEGEHALKREALEGEWARAFADLQAEERDARSRLEAFRASEDKALEERLRAKGGLAGFVLDAAPAKPTLGARLRRWWRLFLRVILWPLRVLLRAFDALFGRKDRKPAHDKTVRIAVPVGGSVGAHMASNLGAALDGSPELRRRARDRLRAAPPRERVRRAWDRLLGREDYEQLMQKALAQLLEEEAREAERDVQEARQDFERQLGDVLEREEARKREREEALDRLMQERDRDAARLEEQLRKAPEREVKEELMDQLKASGLLRERDGDILPTLQFMDSFAASVYAEETRSLRAGAGGSEGEFAEAVGNFQRGPMRHRLELSHADFVASKLRARSRHPKVRRMMEDDILVYREEREALQHVVVIFDRSGSMEENDRLDAAKRATLALYHAVKQENPRNRVDVIMMDTAVERVDLMGVWNAEPKGFTNTAGALRLAARLLEEGKSERALVYLVTDGLPEAYTVDGRDVAGHPEKALEHAVAAAKHLGRVRGLGGFVCLLLEPEDELFVEAAEKLAEVLDGRVMSVDPSELAGELIRSFEGGTKAALSAP